MDSSDIVPVSGVDVDSLERIYGPISVELRRVQAGIDRQVQLLAEDHEKLIERHAYFREIIGAIRATRGKLLRPALVLLSGKAAGIPRAKNSSVNTQLITVAVAAELVHAASLIHDDIIDGAVTRRSHLALHRKFGTTIAVLVGDVLYSQFFSLISRLELPASQCLRLVQIFCGVTKTMSQGEIFQHGIKNYGIEVTVEDYLGIIKSKTALLMSACCAAGCLVGGGTEAQISTTADFGLQFGLAFQLMDDQIDQDSMASDIALTEYAGKHGRLACTALTSLPNGKPKESLNSLVRFILGQ